MSQIPARREGITGGKRVGIGKIGNALFADQPGSLREEKVLTGVISELLATAQIFKAVTKQSSIHLNPAALDLPLLRVWYCFLEHKAAPGPRKGFKLPWQSSSEYFLPPA